MALGWRQADCLRKMLEHGGKWWPRCGWFYGDSSTETLRLLQSLERRGLVDQHVTLDRIEWHVRDPERGYAAIVDAMAPRTGPVKAPRKKA